MSLDVSLKTYFSRNLMIRLLCSTRTDDVRQYTNAKEVIAAIVANGREFLCLNRSCDIKAILINIHASI